MTEFKHPVGHDGASFDVKVPPVKEEIPSKEGIIIVTDKPEDVRVTTPKEHKIAEDTKVVDYKSDLKIQIEESHKKLVKLARSRNYTDIGINEPYFSELANLRKLNAELKS